MPPSIAGHKAAAQGGQKPSTFQVCTAPRFLRRALLLAGRLPWLDFFNLRWGLAIAVFLPNSCSAAV